MSKRSAFVYQINFNRKKYPEICEALEKAKENNGIAWYLRKLIEKDIHGERLFEFGSQDEESVKNRKEEAQEVNQKEEIKQEPQKEKQDQQSSQKELLPDNSGGFL